jgi:Rod binding domain-containing protein
MPSVNGGGLMPSLASPGAASLTPNPQATPHAGAQAFEGMFASMLIKQMRQSLGGNSLCGHDKNDALGGLFDHFMGDHMASNGGLGIGAMIRKQLELRSTNNVQQQPQRTNPLYTAAPIPLHSAPAERSYSLNNRPVAGVLPGNSVSPAQRQ